MKFTEEQYQKIVEIQEESFPKTIISEGIHINDGGFLKVVSEKMPLLSEYVFNNDLHFELAALANPLTREWAHDKFVEKEKKSHFVLKDVRDDNGNLYHLIESGGAVVLNPWLNSGYQPKIKESDVRKWGFNPEMFDREETQ